jgi:hypothetical protein
LSLSNSPKLLKTGLELIDPQSAKVLRIISLQYNPDSLSRSLQVQTAGGESANRSEPMRFKGPAVETIKLEAEIDAADQLEFPEQHRATVEHGIQPQLAVLEALAHPSSAQLRRLDAQASSGTLEVAPMEAPLLLFVWSKTRVVPVRLTEFSITGVFKPDDIRFSRKSHEKFMFMDHKEVIGKWKDSYYASEDGLQTLKKMIERDARIARGMGPNCQGFGYTTNDENLAELIDSLIRSAGNKSLQRVTRVTR